MNRLRMPRQAARRAVLMGRAAAHRARGDSAGLAQATTGGLAILLLHNTLGRDADSLVSHVAKHRERFTDFDAVETLGIGRGPAQIALTFDDGFRSNLQVARRLHSLGLQACFYVPTDIIGSDQPEVDAFFGRPQQEGVMTWDDLEEVRSLGHVVGSHCRQHRPLIDLSDAEGEDQIKRSLEELRRRLGQSEHFAWPFGSLRHADAAKVVQWCTEADARAASGVRGFNTRERLDSEGYLRRDAIDIRWIGVDIAAFLGRDAARSR
ncbi:polysaccharide deacetylase family protein [Janibacter corallicola]|uniref:polysaccharide deacetylase family protein n=1 Tax=Janibacter corallicola TaxID=415212 RepID=UPI000A00417F|nr:polysaccharide deacetylase family protein [Janibacter corallicola]